MDIRCIAEHTIDLSLINKASKVIDLGCRAFSWSKAMLEYVGEIVSIDADKIQQPDEKRIILFNYAVTDGENEAECLCCFGNGTGNYIITKERPATFDNGMSKQIIVESITIKFLLVKLGWAQADLIKIDIEGFEVPVILSLEEPPAKQLSIEWHMHTGTTQETIDKCFDHLKGLGYKLVFSDYSRKHGLPLNYWDTLFILQS